VWLGIAHDHSCVFREWLVNERTKRADDVVKEISGHVGGQQTFLGPTLAIPYSVPPQSPADFTKYGTYLVFPAQASATLKTTTEERHRSLFKVPVFQADLKFDANFDLSGVPAAAPQGAELDWSHAEIIVGVKRCTWSAGRRYIDDRNEDRDACAGGDCREHFHRWRSKPAHQIVLVQL
jgi:inner membrane protein involved in colicin E2 resistance